MRKLLTILLSLLTAVMPVTVHATEEENTYQGPEIAAEAAVLIDASTGTVLLEKNADARYAPAGLAKMMGIYTASESIRDNRQVTMASDTFATYDHAASVLWIQEEETLNIRDLEYASMLSNANDTMAMIAQEYGGADKLLAAMNKQASDWELENTHFGNIFGLYDEETYSSVRDLAVLTRRALRSDRFASVYRANSYIIQPTNLQLNQRVLAAGCELIRAGNDHYAEAQGCKIGYTKEGGFVLSAEARRGNTVLIAAVAGENSEAACYKDIRALFEYGFEHYRTVTITKEEIGEEVVEVYEGRRHTMNVIFTAANDFSALLPATVSEDLLTYEAEVVGRDSSDPTVMSAELVFKLDGTEVTRVPMEKRTETYQNETLTGEESTLRYYFDLFSIGVLVLFFFFFAGKGLRPPE